MVRLNGVIGNRHPIFFCKRDGCLFPLLYHPLILNNAIDFRHCKLKRTYVYVNLIEMKIACTIEKMIPEVVIANEIKCPVENSLYI